MIEKIDQKILEEIVKVIKQIDYGEVVITIHNSQIVQIERKEKRRFDLEEPLHKQS